ncbi:hypothetical protein GCM10008927_15100 [Amylibacter ulvae]|uniref:Uncharacterized protein n=1 Tax=Paramylibacter ulvae TaxID=1651968 RepID=A0ABQ3D120_9RHOB|nr:hypothetical protein GCM10008927_15100 [Amylibacter ulvae]
MGFVTKNKGGDSRPRPYLPHGEGANAHPEVRVLGLLSTAVNLNVVTQPI